MSSRTTTKPKAQQQAIDLEPATTTAIEKAKKPPVEKKKPVETLVPEDEGIRYERFQGVGTGHLTAEEKKALLAPFPDEEHDILPTGEVYVAQVYVRRRLNTVLGPLEWALVPDGPWVLNDKETDKNPTVAREYHLVMRGIYAAAAMGEADYHPKNARMSYPSACEAAKSDALKRCAKDVGIAAECWEKRWADQWKKRFAVGVWVKEKNWKSQQEETKFRWRRTDADPFHGEQARAPEGKTPQQRPQARGNNKPAQRVLTHDEVDLIRTEAREFGLSVQALDSVVRNETGQTDLYRVTADKFERVLKAIRSVRR